MMIMNTVATSIENCSKYDFLRDKGQGLQERDAGESIISDVPDRSD